MLQMVPHKMKFAGQQSAAFPAWFFFFPVRLLKKLIQEASTYGLFKYGELAQLFK